MLLNKTVLLKWQDKGWEDRVRGQRRRTRAQHSPASRVAPRAAQCLAQDASTLKMKVLALYPHLCYDGKERSRYESITRETHLLLAIHLTFPLPDLSMTQEPPSSLTFGLWLCTTVSGGQAGRQGDVMGRTGRLEIQRPESASRMTSSCPTSRVARRWECWWVGKLE